LPRKCPFIKGLKCGRPKSYCQRCPERIKHGQRLLVPDIKDEERIVSYTTDAEIKKVTCPYCLYTDYIFKFYIKLKSGRYSEKRFKCPDCGEIMRRDTLTQPMTVEEYAEWVYEMGKYFWSRVNFSVFKKRLKEMGISKRFWDAYKRAKAESGTESYEEYLMRKQKEMMEEEGYYSEMPGE